jgi:hypothetical protein
MKNRPVVWLVVYRNSRGYESVLSAHLSEGAAERAERRELRRRGCRPSQLMVEPVSGPELL